MVKHLISSNACFGTFLPIDAVKTKCRLKYTLLNEFRASIQGLIRMYVFYEPYQLKRALGLNIPYWP